MSVHAIRILCHEAMETMQTTYQRCFLSLCRLLSITVQARPDLVRALQEGEASGGRPNPNYQRAMQEALYRANLSQAGAGPCQVAAPAQARRAPTEQGQMRMRTAALGLALGSSSPGPQTRP